MTAFMLSSLQTSSGSDQNWWTIVVIGFLILILFFAAIFLGKFVTLWLQAYMSKAQISIWDIVGMSFRKVNPSIIVRAKISAVQAKIPSDTQNLESHYLAGGNVINLVRSLIAADRAGLGLDFQRASAIDLAGRDVLEAVRTCVNPKVIDCPQVTAMSKDGIQVLANAKVTVRTNIERLVGGATEETIIARVGEGIVSTIGSSESHKQVLENPDNISKTVLAKGLDSGTAFEILSIDIADVDIGKNIGAVLQGDQAEADMRIAQAKAEERRAMAVAVEQEMQAAVVENRAKVVLAEAEVPLAISDAFRAGHMGVIDYMKYKNIEADTSMRRNLGPSADGGTQDSNQEGRQG